MEGYPNFYGHQINVDRGLQSNSLSDVLGVISTYGAYIQECPFPAFTNFILLRLAETFQGEKYSLKLVEFLNDVRLRIVKSLRENGKVIRLAFSGGRHFEATEAVIRCAMKVSHSNDYRARSLTLLFLGSLAPLIAENKKAHHLLIESLDAPESTELLSAIDASNEFGKNSASFAILFAEKLPALLNSISDESTTIRLLDTMSNLKESLAVAATCLETVAPMLEKSYSNRVRAAFYNSMTKLAMKNRLFLTTVLEKLLSELEKCMSSRFLNAHLLKNLNNLAAYPHQWDRDHLVKLEGIGNLLYSTPTAASLWLKCMETLLTSGIQSSIQSGTEHSWIRMLCHADYDVRTSAIALAVGVLSCSTAAPSTAPLQLEPIIAPPILRNIHEVSTSAAKRRFLRILTGQRPACSQQMLLYIADELMIAENEQDAEMQMQALCALCEAHPSLYSRVSGQAHNRFKGMLTLGKGVAEIPFSLFNLLLAPVADSESLSDLMEVISTSDMDHWTRYKLARMGFRYGHWRKVAFPMLDGLRSHSRIDVLNNVAQAENDTTTVNSLEEKIGKLRRASLLLKPLVLASPKWRQFAFASSFLNSMGATFEGIRSTLTLLNVKLFTLAGCHDAAPLENIKIGLSVVQKGIVKARQDWSNLYLRSFDADDRTLNTIHAFSQLNSLIENISYVVCGNQQKLPSVADFPNENASVTDRSLLSSLRSVKEKMESAVNSAQEGEASANFSQVLEKFKEVLVQVGSFRVGLPRHFFQRAYTTMIKLNTSPQPKEGGTYISTSSVRLPFTVEGVIQSDNPKRIETVTVKVEISFVKNEEKSYSKRQTINLVGSEMYFRCQFMLHVPQMANLKLGISFTDSDVKRTWLDESTIQFALHPRE